MCFVKNEIKCMFFLFFPGVLFVAWIAFASTYGSKSFFQRGDELRKIFRNSAPNYLVTDIKVAMHQLVSHANDHLPRNLWNICPSMCGYRICSFANHEQFSNDSTEKKSIML